MATLQPKAMLGGHRTKVGSRAGAKRHQVGVNVLGADLASALPADSLTFAPSRTISVTAARPGSVDFTVRL